MTCTSTYTATTYSCITYTYIYLPQKAGLLSWPVDHSYPRSGPIFRQGRVSAV